jgi:hypothetical protein
MSLENKVKHLDHVLLIYEKKGQTLQAKRLFFGLSFFILLVLSQVFKTLSLEIFALVIILPFFVFYFRKSRQFSLFHLSLSELKVFYLKQINFNQGIFDKQVAPEDMVDPQLSRDLDLGYFFYTIDNCFSLQGQRLLNSWICQNFAQSSLVKRTSNIKELIRFPGLIRRIQKTKSSKLINFEAIEKEISRPFLNENLIWKWLIPISWLLLIFCLIVKPQPILWKICLLTYVGSGLFYMGQTKYLFSRLQDLFNDFETLRDKIVLFEKLGGFLSFTPSLKKNEASQDVKKISFFISLMSLRTNPILFYILNFILPWDFIITELSERARLNLYKKFNGWSQEIIEIEALSSLANLKIYQNTVWPELSHSNEFVDVKNLSHPLLNQQSVIKNSFKSLEQRIFIITGSNMSGKSTFLRSLGINLCLANIGAPVFAETMKFKPLKIITCIRVSDSLRDGQSYFYAEVQRMKKILLSAQDEPVFFLIDEPLRGTNNKERLIGNQSYLKKILLTQACGFLCTHDLELTQLSETSELIKNYHFSEQWQNNDLYFDYKIKLGPSQTTNALKILEKENLI